MKVTADPTDPRRFTIELNELEAQVMQLASRLDGRAVGQRRAPGLVAGIVAQVESMGLQDTEAALLAADEPHEAMEARA